VAPKVSEAHRSEVRDRILNATERTLARKGLLDLSLDDVVESSGLSKGAIYGHFRNKEDLLLSVHDREIARRYAEVQARFASDTSARQRLVALTDAFLSPMAEAKRPAMRAFIEFLVATPRSRRGRSRLDHRYQEDLRVLASIVEEGVRAGELREDLDPRAVAAVLAAFIDGLSLDWALTTGAEPTWTFVGPTLTKILFEGLEPRRPTRGRGVVGR